MLAREGHEGLIRALACQQVLPDRVVVLNRARDAVGHHHRAGLAADLVERHHLVVEVVHHDLGLELDGLLVALDVTAQLLLGAFRVELGIPLDRLDELVVARDRRVRPQHVQDEALLDRLLHGVAVKRAVLPLPARVVRLTEDLQRLVLGRGGKGEITRVREELPRRHDAVDPVLGSLVLFLGPRRGERQADGGRGLAALARMRLVDEDGEASAPARRGLKTIIPVRPVRRCPSRRKPGRASFPASEIRSAKAPEIRIRLGIVPSRPVGRLCSAPDSQNEDPKP